MTTERIKEIQSKTAYPESVSVQQALLQVWNECEQEQLRLHNVSGSVTYQGITYKWGDKVVSPNGYEFFVVTDEGRWGLVDHGGTFCELQDCDLTGYLHCH